MLEIWEDTSILKMRSMQLQYRKIQHLIQFQNPVSFPTLPTFLFRSVIGKELRRLVCIFRTLCQNICHLDVRRFESDTKDAAG